jgi:hypothetical protein
MKANVYPVWIVGANVHPAMFCIVFRLQLGLYKTIVVLADVELNKLYNAYNG